MLALNDWRHRPDYRIGADLGAKSSNAAANRGIAYHRRVYRAIESTDLGGLRFLTEPWLQEVGKGRFCQPDSILFDDDAGIAIVVEVKLNWKDGRADKLLNLYLPAVKAAFGLDATFPVVVTSNLRGYEHPPLLGLGSILDAMAWEAGQPCPVLLHP
jgi:hypothetical protein